MIITETAFVIYLRNSLDISRLDRKILTEKHLISFRCRLISGSNWLLQERISHAQSLDETIPCIQNL